MSGHLQNLEQSRPQRLALGGFMHLRGGGFDAQNRHVRAPCPKLAKLVPDYGEYISGAKLSWIVEFLPQKVAYLVVCHVSLF